MTWVPLYQKGTWVKIFSGEFNNFLRFYPAAIYKLKSFQVNDLRREMSEKIKGGQLHHSELIPLFKSSFSQNKQVLSYANKKPCNNAVCDNLDFGIKQELIF